MPTSNAMSQSDDPIKISLISSLRYDPILLRHTDSPFYHLDAHIARLYCAGQEFSYPTDGLSSLSLRLKSIVSKHFNGFDHSALKVKIVLNPAGFITIDLSPTPSTKLDSLFPDSLTTSILPWCPNDWSVILDTAPTSPSNYTRFKTSYRDHYEAARLRVNIQSWCERREVLLWNEHGEVMEGSFTNVYFLRNQNWVTPHANAGGLNGVQRSRLLSDGLVTEGLVKKEHVKTGERILLSNGVRGVWSGIIVLDISPY